MKLTDAQRNDLRAVFRTHRGGTADSLEVVFDLMDQMFSGHSELPQWRDPVLDPPSDDDLSLDGEVLVRVGRGLYCTDRPGIPGDAKWLCVKDLADLPVRDYPVKTESGLEDSLRDARFLILDLHRDTWKSLNAGLINRVNDWVNRNGGFGPEGGVL